MRSPRKSLLSNISKRSVRSLLGRKSNITRTLDCKQTNNKIGGARSKILIQATNTDIEQGALTCETNLDSSEEEVFFNDFNPPIIITGFHCYPYFLWHTFRKMITNIFVYIKLKCLNNTKQ